MNGLLMFSYTGRKGKEVISWKLERYSNLKGTDTVETPLDHWSSADFMGEEEEEEAVSTVGLLYARRAHVCMVLWGGG